MAGGATGAGGGGAGRSLSRGGRLICASAGGGESHPFPTGARTEARKTKQAAQNAAKPLGAEMSLVVAMGGYTTRSGPPISSLWPKSRIEGRRMNPDTSRSSLLRGSAAVAVGSFLGLGALTAPWLTIRGDLGRGNDPVVEAADAKTSSSGGKVRGAGERSGLLLLFPAPAPPRSQLASQAPALAAAAPDPGSVLALEKRLKALSYMVGSEDGTFDSATRFGLTAFQKVEGLSRTGVPDGPTLARLDSAQRPAPSYREPADHLEVDIRRQVVFVVRRGQVSETLPTSTGNGQIFRSQGRRSRAVTPNGQFAITYKRSGWRRSPLGLLYKPAYFNGGIAFHGAKSVPNEPASHGCVRLPMAFADWFADSASPPGMVVYVYGNPGQPDPAPVGASPPISVPAPAPEGGQVPPGEAPGPQNASPLLGELLGGGGKRSRPL